MASIRDRLLKNVNDYIEIRKIAQEYNDDRITYEVAKIYFELRDVIKIDDAIEICNKAREFNVPTLIILESINDFALYPIDLAWNHIYSTVEKKYSTDFTKRIGYPDYYSLSIARLSSNMHIPLEFAKKLTDLKINLYEKVRRVSHEVAVLGATYGMTKKAAIHTLKAIDFLEENNMHEKTDFTIHKVRKYLEESPEFYRKTINGILVAATSEKRLDLIEKMIKKAYAEGDKEYLEQLTKKSNERDLIVTDLQIHDRSCFNPWGELIYIDKSIDKKKIDLQAGLFYHESSHFLDYDSVDHYSVYSKEVNDNFQDLNKNIFDNTFSNILNRMKVNEEVKTKISAFLYKHNVHTKIKGLKMMFTTKNRMAENYIKNEELRNKWKDEINTTKSEYSEKDRRMFFQQKLGYEKAKYINLIGAISDIYDAIDKGSLYDWMGLTGHGKKYYSRPGYDVIEFVAEVGQIINSGGTDILAYEFGEGFSKSFQEMYSNLVNHERPKPTTTVQVIEPQKDDLEELLDFKYNNEEYNTLKKQLSNKQTQIQEMLSDTPLDTTRTTNIENDSIEVLSNSELQNMLDETSDNRSNDKTI